MKEIYPMSTDIQESILVHIPHSSTNMPENIDKSLYSKDLDISTDWYTDLLFKSPLTTLTANFSRIFCDVERFIPDSMDKYGRGFNYTKDFEGNSYSFTKNTDLVLEAYINHHLKFKSLVQEKLDKKGTCLIIDGHSFNEEPLYYEREGDRPDICIGIDSFHTPNWLRNYVVSFYKEKGFSVEINFPYSGSIVPLKFYRENKSISSIMIEINKKLYMHNLENIKILNEDFIKLIENIY